MFAQRATVAARVFNRRMMSTVYNTPAKGVRYEKTFKETWLSDQGAWPVLGIISGAVVFCTCFCTNKLLNHKDVRITPSARRADIRTW